MRRENRLGGSAVAKVAKRCAMMREREACPTKCDPRESWNRMVDDWDSETAGPLRQKLLIPEIFA